MEYTLMHETAKEINDAMAATGYSPLRRVAISILATGILIEGTVPSYYLKQVAQTVAKNAGKTSLVMNHLHVVDEA